MQAQPPIDFRIADVTSGAQRFTQIRNLLADSGLGMDNDITTFVEAGRDSGWWVVRARPPMSSNVWR